MLRKSTKGVLPFLSTATFQKWFSQNANITDHVLGNWVYTSKTMSNHHALLRVTLPIQYHVKDYPSSYVLFCMLKKPS